MAVSSVCPAPVDNGCENINICVSVFEIEALTLKCNVNR